MAGLMDFKTDDRLRIVYTMERQEVLLMQRMVLQHYNARDIFNCDETGLLWKMVPDRGLSTRSLPGRKKEKARITAHLCCNSDGSERLPIWFIGKAQQPHAFRAAGIIIENLNLK
uniref:Ars binding protein 1 n=1 Tax=Coccidioides posadasii RMSCC 3488 TaxID=454284 RepID=A0A0J6EYS8_COCPO|nr:ars binding protein 1 [Coccidioides posadasii RMSCC 3488]